MDLENYNQERRLPLKLKLAYGVGHVLNDICASMWFTYLLVFFHLVLQFDSFMSGIILLVGQIADGVSTPFVGVQSDIDDDFWLFRYGRRKTWHLIDMSILLGSFPFIFSPCIKCQNSHQWAQLIYYSAFIIIFQFGWGAVQVSHLSLIPDLTPNEHERTELTAIRYSFTVCSNLLVYLVTWLILHMTNDSGDDEQIGAEDASSFQHVVLVGLVVGSVMSLVFHVFVPEHQTSSCTRTQEERKSMGQILKEMKLYQVAGVYMATRLFTNLTQVYIPLYLHGSLSMSAESLAIIPLIMFVASFTMSMVVKVMNKKCGRMITFVLGALMGIAACIWIHFGSAEDENFTKYEIYPITVLLGAACSVLLVTSLSITADFIGSNTETGAFVYGLMSFSDKLANGVFVTIIQHVISKCSES
ncbi:hypothetical protein L9F63_005726, partial [Diploptera punctata]